MTRFTVILLALLFHYSVDGQTPGSPCDSSVDVALKHYKIRQYEEAIVWFEKAVSICSRDTGMSDYDYYSMLAFLSTAYHEIGREDSAIITGEAAVKYFEKIDAHSQEIYNRLLGSLGAAYSNYGEYKNAVKAFEKCIPWYKKNSSALVVKWYELELARCYSATDELDKAFALNYRIKAELLSSTGKNHTQYIAVLSNIGNDFIRIGLYDSAFIYHSESVQLRQTVFGKIHYEYAKGLGMLAQVYSYQNKFADAIIIYEQSKDVYTQTGFSKSNEYATLLVNLSECYRILNDLKKAYNYLSEALKIKRNLYGNYHPDIASAVNNVGSVLEDGFDYKQALEAYLHAKHILDRLRMTETSLYAGVLGNLGNCYTNIPKYDSAVYFLEKGLQLKEKLFGKDHISVATTLNNLASVYEDLKLYKEAEGAYYRSISILEKIFGKKAFQLFTIYQNLSLVYKAKSEIARADSMLQKAFELRSEFIINNTEGLSEKDKEGFAQELRFNQSTGISLRELKKLSNNWIFNSSLFYKGLLLEGSKGFVAAFKNISDTAIKRKVNEFLSLKAFIGEQLLKPEASRSKNLPQVINRTAILERELLQASASFRSWKQQFQIKWNEIQKSLKPGSVAIEFLAYYPMGIKTTDSTRCAAMIIKPDVQEPIMVSLFSEGIFNRLIAKGGSTESVVKKLYRAAVKVSSSQPTASDSLFHLLWKPLLPHLQNAKTVYFSADGVVNNLNLAAIITPEGKRLVEDYEFIQLSSTRNIVKPSLQPGFSNMQLWGGVSYNDNTTSTSNRSATFSYLPGTLSEVNEIGAAASKDNKKIKIVSAANANETNFKQLSGNSPEVLHIATHGFFFPDPSAAKQKMDNRFANASNPLLRSGLALANANENWRNEMNASNKEDGILTAYEIADLDLSKTKLVVLSACETGLGDIKSGEGVYGLQRAFKMAGVHYLIMSLWQVPDLETKEFMQTFYANCFAGMPIRKAFRETQLAMNKKYQPYQWAAFVLVE